MKVTRRDFHGEQGIVRQSLMEELIYRRLLVLLETIKETIKSMKSYHLRGKLNKG